MSKRINPKKFYVKVDQNYTSEIQKQRKTILKAARDKNILPIREHQFEWQ